MSTGANMNNLAARRRQAGFTLLEALVVMVVGVFISAAAFGGNKLYTASRVSDEASNITQIATNLKPLKNDSRGYADLTVPLALSRNAVPLSMSQTSSTISSPWGSVTVGPVSVADSDHHMIAYQNVPEEACQQLALKLRSGGWTTFTVNNQVIGPSTPIDGAAGSIQSACANPSNTLVFTSS